MNILTNDTAIKLLCCAEAFGAMIDKGELPDADQITLAINAMVEAIPALQASDPIGDASTQRDMHLISGRIDGLRFALEIIVNSMDLAGAEHRVKRQIAWHMSDRSSEPPPLLSDVPDVC